MELCVGIFGKVLLVSPFHRLYLPALDGTKCFTSMGMSSDSSLVVRLSPWPYGLFLVSTVVLQVSCIVYLGILARVYWLLSEPFMGYFMQLLVPGSPSAYFKRWGLVFAIIGSLHLFDLVQAAYRGFVSFRLLNPRRLRRGESRVAVAASWDQRSRKLGALGEKHLRASTQGQAPLMSARRIRRSVNAVNSFAATFASQFEVFGVRSPYFHAVFLCRECLEIAAQSYQVYRSSMLVARPSINSLAVILHVLNCWSTPCLQYMFRRHRVWSRISCVFCDGILNMGTSMVLPFMVFLPYAQAFNPDVFMYLPVEMLYVEVEFTNLVIENKSVFVINTSFLDGFLKIFSNLAICGCFRTIRSIVRLNTHRKVKRHKIENRAVMPIHFSTKSEQPSSANKRRIYRLSHFLANLLFCLGGIIVLALHVLARRRTSAVEVPLGCLQTMHPWFAVSYTCAAFEFNCNHHQVDSPNATALDALDQDTLLYIGFAIALPFAYHPHSEIFIVLSE